MGRTSFQKHAFIKTLLIGILCFVLLNYLNQCLLYLMLPEYEIISATMFDSFQFGYLGNVIKVVLPESIEGLSRLFIRCILPLSLWTLVWLKLKEKQV